VQRCKNNYNTQTFGRSYALTSQLHEEVGRILMWVQLLEPDTVICRVDWTTHCTPALHRYQSWNTTFTPHKQVHLDYSFKGGQI